MIAKSLVALTLCLSVAHAQPGETVPSQPPPPPPDAGAQVTVAQPADIEASIESVLAQVAAQSPTLEGIVRGTVNRGRRAISIGPSIGAWTGGFTAQEQFETALTVGVGVELFKVPVLPDMQTIKALVQERAKAKLRAHLLAIVAGRPPEPLELESMAKQVYEEVVAEFLGQNVRPKRFERPRLNVGFEMNRLFEAGAWVPRFRAGLGVWKFTVGLSVSGACLGGPCGDRLELYTGPEVVLHMMTTKNPRSSVIDAYLRVDLQATGRSEIDPYDQVVLGARFLLDLI